VASDQAGEDGSGEQLGSDFRDALTLAAAAGTIGSPVTHARLLEMIVETAAHVISARSAALFLLDEEAQELVFEVALGTKAAEAKKYRIPLGHGIAGLVVASGQPIAISDAAADPRLAADIAEGVGYIPESVLCVPLFYGDHVIGAVELLDKDGASSFDATDIEALSLFANLAAVALQQSRTHQNLAALMGDVLGSFEGERERGLAALVEDDPAFRESLELARLVHEIVNHGENEREACHVLLAGFADYLRLRPRAGGEPMMLR
jgi:GAF domain-containing protein